MAKLKTKIKDLMAKYGISEEASRELLELHDGDLSEAQSAAQEAVNKVQEWNKWYSDVAPGITSRETELSTLKVQLDEAKRMLGMTPNPTPNPTPNTPNTDNSFDPEALENRIYQNFSTVQKDIYNIQRYHMKNFGELPDLEPIEKLIAEKKLSPLAAYNEWVAPMDNERKEKELRTRIEKEVTEKFQADATRRGTNFYQRPESEAVSPLDEDFSVAAPKPEPRPGERVDPSELELMADFVGSMRNGRSLSH